MTRHIKQKTAVFACQKPKANGQSQDEHIFWHRIGNACDFLAIIVERDLYLKKTTASSKQTSEPIGSSHMAYA